MVDDFMVCVDRIIASACFQSVNEGVVERRERDEIITENFSVTVKSNGEGCSKKAEKKGGGEMIECRICQEEDEEQEMEAPCACNGTLKFAHRKCIQRWCNKKGDIICEICNQVYAPNYSLPPRITNPDGMAFDIRQAWGHRIDLRDSHFLALAAEHQLLHSEYDDYAMANTTGVTCFRSIALFLMLVLLVRHALIVATDSGMLQESSTFFNVLFLKEMEKRDRRST
ncbi:zinc finger protein [Macleaya cordata]|uniref:Zinc finger protein n=1 Tax=Macleaya cordata TaxID=56857 RepID=A0A200PPI2_MACCD|nr:zinc finger protein [Macleaya cordata]